MGVFWCICILAAGVISPIQPAGMNKFTCEQELVMVQQWHPNDTLICVRETLGE